jgi:hypothetical protein
LPIVVSRIITLVFGVHRGRRAICTGSSKWAYAPPHRRNHVSFRPARRHHGRQADV